MKRLVIPILLLAAATSGFAQLTTDQKVSDFRQLIGLFDKRYAPYDWKKQLFQMDILDAQPWLDRVTKSESDLDYYEICVAYVTSLHDGNSRFNLPSDFRARLGISINLVQDVAIISSVERNLLPASQYPFDFGDLVISLDGKTPREWTDALAKYVSAGSDRAARQIAAGYITDRYQQSIPRAVEVGDSAAVVILRAATGTIETYSIPWVKTGAPLAAGPVPSPKARLPVRLADENPGRRANSRPCTACRRAFSSASDDPRGTRSSAALIRREVTRSATCGSADSTPPGWNCCNWILRSRGCSRTPRA